MKLTEETLLRVQRLFVAGDRGEAIRLLEIEGNLPVLDRAGPKQMERFHFAMLKLSDGDLEQLRESIELAGRDWRRLLEAAGFGDSGDAHSNWHPAQREQA